MTYYYQFVKIFKCDRDNHSGPHAHSQGVTIGGEQTAIRCDVSSHGEDA